MKAVLAKLMPTSVERIDMGAVVALTVIAIAAFRSSYGGVAFLVLGVLSALIGLVVAHTGQRYRVPLVISGAIAIVVYAVVGGVLALPERAIFGFIPSPSSILVALRMSITGWRQLITTAPPVGRTGDLMAVPVLAGMAAGYAGLLLSQRLRSGFAPLVPSLIVLGLAIASGTNTPVSVILHGCVFAMLAIAWLAWREHQRRPLLQSVGLQWKQLVASFAVLVVAAAGGYSVADRLPSSDDSRDIWRQTVTPPFDPREFPSPLAGYRRYVRTSSNPRAEDPTITDASVNDVVMFTVEGLPEGVPVRLATLDAFDGLVWQVSGGDPDEPSLDNSGSFERVGASLAPEHEGEMATVTVTIGNYSDVWIPDVGEVVVLTFFGSAGGPERDQQLATQFRYNRATDTAASPLRLQPGDRYVMEVSLPELFEDLAGEVVEPTGAISHLPATQTGVQFTEKLASDVLVETNDSGERLDLVRNRMLAEGTYSDGDVQEGQVAAQPGHSDFRLGTFVGGLPRTPLIGNAEQYATSYALLFRELDVATRVVMGFMPEASSEFEPVHVYSSQVEAWVEVSVVDHGWVPVFPTPPRDQTSITSSSPQQPEPDYRTQNPPPPPLIDPEFDQPAKASGDAQTPDEETAEEEDEEGTAFSPLATRTGKIALAAGSPFVMLAIVSGGIVALKRRRRGRRQTQGLGHERIANGWREMIDFSLDLGRYVPSETTRREAAGFVGSDTLALANRADAAVWSLGQPSEEMVSTYWNDVEQVINRIRQELSPVKRVIAMTSLHSLREGRSTRRKGSKNGT